MTFITALAVAWFITAAIIVALYLWRYARDWADLRETEARYADEWRTAHRVHQDSDRYLTDRPGSPE